MERVYGLDFNRSRLRRHDQLPDVDRLIRCGIANSFGFGLAYADIDYIVESYTLLLQICNIIFM